MYKSPICVFAHLFFECVFPVHVRVAVQCCGPDERRSLAHLLVVIIVRRSGVVPRVQAVQCRLVEAHAVQPEERALRPETDHGHGVVGRLAHVVGHLELRQGHAVAPEVRVPVHMGPVHEPVVAGARDQRFADGAVHAQRVQRELGGGAGQLETVPVLHVYPALGVRIDDRVPPAVAGERYGHFGRVLVGHPQRTVLRLSICTIMSYYNNIIVCTHKQYRRIIGMYRYKR